MSYTMDEMVLMQDFVTDKYTEAYCRRKKCSACTGTDVNGEPNGYGCEGLTKRIDTMYRSILSRRRVKQIKQRSGV